MSASASTEKKTSTRTVTPKFPYLTILITTNNNPPTFLFAPATDSIKKYFISSTGETGSLGDATSTSMIYDLLRKVCSNDINKIYISGKTTGINSTYIKTTFNNKYYLKYDVVIVGPSVKEEKFKELLDSDEKCSLKNFKWEEIFDYSSSTKEFYSTFADPVVIDYKFNEQRNNETLKAKAGYEDSIEKGKSGLTRIFRTFTNEEYTKKAVALENGPSKSQCKDLFTVKCKKINQPVKKDSDIEVECIEVTKTYNFNNIDFSIGACMKDLFANAFDKFNAEVIAKNKPLKSKGDKTTTEKKETTEKKQTTTASASASASETSKKSETPGKRVPKSPSKSKKQQADYDTDDKAIKDDDEGLPDNDNESENVMSAVKSKK